jgi:hypothetical protein
MMSSTRLDTAGLYCAVHVFAGLMPLVLLGSSPVHLIARVPPVSVSPAVTPADSECFFNGSKLEAFFAEESSLVARVGIGTTEHELPLGVAIGPCLWLAGAKVGDLALLNVGDDDAAHVADGIPLC